MNQDRRDTPIVGATASSGSQSELPSTLHRQAWQPLTPAGVAGFARASLGRLLIVQLVVAIISASSVVWFIHTCWFPVIRSAIVALPEVGEIRSGKLDWRVASPQTLAENRFLALTVDLKHKGESRSPAHLQAEFGQVDLRIYSILGNVAAGYPRNRTVAFNRLDLQPWWGAWAPEILAVASGAIVVVLLLVWWALASVHAPLVWLIGFFANRQLNWGGSFRLAAVALLPGALFFSGLIVCYGLGGLDVVRLLAGSLVHFVIGWAYLGLSPLWLPKQGGAGTVLKNPFLSRPTGSNCGPKPGE